MRYVAGMVSLVLFGMATAEAQLPRQTRPDQVVPSAPRSSLEAPAPVTVPRFSPGVGKLPAAATPGERLVAPFDRLSRDARLLEGYVANQAKVRAANEFQKPEAVEEEARRLRQIGVAQDFWVAGLVEVGSYDRERRGFPVLGNRFVVRDPQDVLRFELADSSPLLFIPLQPSQAELVLAETGNARQFQVLVKASPVALEIRKDGSSSKAVLFGSAKAITVWVPKKDDARQAFLISSATVDEKAAARDAPPPAPTRRAAVEALNYETVDLLLVKHAPDRVSDEMYLHMLASRWSHERSSPRGMVPRGQLPRFFKANQPPPNVVDSRAMLPAFKEWARREAENLPDTFQALVNGGGSLWSQCTYFIGLGTHREADLPARLQGVMDAGQYRALQQRYADQGAANDRLRSEGAGPDRHYRMGPLYFSIGPHHQSRPEVESSCDSNRAAYEAATRSLFGNRKVQGLPRGVIEVQDWVTHSKGTLPAIRESRMTGKVTGVRVVQGVEGPVVLIAMAPTLVEELNTWDVSNVKAEHVIDYASVAVRQAIEDKGPKQPEAPKGPTLDVVGVGLGMTFEEAEAVVAKHMAIGTRINFRPSRPGIAPFNNGRILVRDDKREYITLVDQPETAKGKVVAVGRTVLEAKRELPAETLIAALAEKYGTRMRFVMSGVGFAYQSGGQRPGAKTPEGACYTVMGARAAVVYEMEDGTPVPDAFHRLPERPGFTAQGLPTMGFRDDLTNDPRNFEACLPHVSAIVPEQSGMIDHFTVWMTDPAAHFKAIHDALRAGAKPPERPKL